MVEEACFGIDAWSLHPQIYSIVDTDNWRPRGVITLKSDTSGHASGSISEALQSLKEQIESMSLIICTGSSERFTSWILGQFDEIR